MQNSALVYSTIAMFALTFSLLIHLGYSRLRAIRRREVSIKYFQAYNDGTQPERLHLLGRHVQNHFEVPPLFYAAVTLLLVTDSVSTASVVAAWLYVALRLVHTVIHLGANNVTHRFVCFLLSVLALAALWGSLAYAML